MKKCLGQMFADSDRVDFYTCDGNSGLVEVFYRLKNVIINKYFENSLRNPNRENLEIEVKNYLKKQGLIQIITKHLAEYKIDETKFGSLEISEGNTKMITAKCFKIIAETDKIATDFKKNNF